MERNLGVQVKLRFYDVWREDHETEKPAPWEQNLNRCRVEAARKSQGMKQKELLAQLQVRGVDLNASGLSKLEGQIRFVTDFELLALSDILNVSVSWLLTGEEKK